MITAELIEDEKKKELHELYEMLANFMKKLREAYPGREIRITVNKSDGEDVWLDGNCYSVNRSFYFPD